MDLFLNAGVSAPLSAEPVPEIGRANALFLADLQDLPIGAIREKFKAGQYGEGLHLPSLREWALLAGVSL